jgi:phenylacetate-coenzyme A ligase PaaK-like adenylate-forming protein
MFLEMKRRVPDLAVPVGEWVQQMMHWHFSDDTGAPYWLRIKRELEFDPIRDVRTLDDLRLFGLFDKSALRTMRVGDLVPRGFDHLPRRVFETGGTSGPPCRVVDISTGTYNVAIYRVTLEHRGLAGGDVLAMTPSGPHAYGTFVNRLADTWRGNVFAIDFDPRWVKRCIRDGEPTDGYIAHLMEQTVQLLESQRANLLFTTSVLLKRLVQHLPNPLATYGVRAVCTGGTGCTEEEERYLSENFLSGVFWIDTYGNTLMGHALQADPLAHSSSRAYYLPPPQAFAHVVDPDNWQRAMPHGSRGRILLQTLHRDLLVPNLLERDSAVPVGPHPWFPFDGLQHVKPFVEVNTVQEAIEGVY